MFRLGQRSKAMPPLSGNSKWWVIESERFNTESKAMFRVFNAVIAQNEKTAIEHLRISDEKLDKTLMNAAIRAGKVEDEFDWEPVSTHVRHLSILSVKTQAEVAACDEVLLDMLKDHDFFLDEFNEDPQMAVSGGIYDWPET